MLLRRSQPSRIVRSSDGRSIYGSKLIYLKVLGVAVIHNCIEVHKLKVVESASWQTIIKLYIDIDVFEISISIYMIQPAASTFHHVPGTIADSNHHDRQWKVRSKDYRILGISAEVSKKQL